MIHSRLTLSFLVFVLWIGFNSCQVPHVYEVSVLPSQSLAFFDAMDHALEVVAMFFDSIKNNIYTGTVAFIGNASMPQKEFYSWVRSAIHSLELDVYYFIRNLVGNLELVDRTEKLIFKAEQCLVESSVDLPEDVATKVLQCFTNTVEEPLDILSDATKELQATFDLIEKYSADNLECNEFVCVEEPNPDPTNETFGLLFYITGTIMNGTTFVTNFASSVPNCLLDSITLAPIWTFLDVCIKTLICIL